MSMIKAIQRKTASSEKGAKGLVKGIIACAFQNLAFMLPTSLLYFLVADMLNGGVTGGRIRFYVGGIAVCFALILLTTWFQYNNTYFTTYEESGKRRLGLAERLRKLPLSFFGKRDLADLTSTIMADCEVLEKTCSHFIPGLFGSLISTTIISVGLFAFDWRMALAALWVIPVSVLIVLLSYKIQDKTQAKTMAVKMACADGIQEYIEAVRDLKANNAEQNYLKGLSGKIKNVEKQNFKAELISAVFVTGAGMVLKLGIASVAIVGAALLVNGSLSALTFFMFLLVASRLYDPMQAALQNLAAIIAMRTNVARMNEILDYPIQTGSETLTNNGYDIEFNHSRTNDFYPEFAKSLNLADQVILLDIYPAREQPIPGVTSGLIAERLTVPFVRVTKEEFPEYVKENVKEGVFMTVGAGDIDRFIPIFTEMFGGTDC